MNILNGGMISQNTLEINLLSIGQWIRKDYEFGDGTKKFQFSLFYFMSSILY